MLLRRLLAYIDRDVFSPWFFRSIGATSSEFRSDRDKIQMIARPKYKHHKDENDRGDREHRRREKALDEALQNTFPASDPISVEQPMLPAANGTVDQESANSST
jgi:hypothetical protein